jgi:hypothetical protein
MELADVPDSKSGVRKDVSVQVRPPAAFIIFWRIELAVKNSAKASIKVQGLESEFAPTNGRKRAHG